MRYAMFAAVAVLLCGSGLFAWLGVVVGARAFEAHPDSQPWVYFLFGGAQAGLALVLVILAGLVFTRVRSKQ
jgi:hypothetical protein